MEEKVKTIKEVIPKSITQTFYIALYRTVGASEWNPVSNSGFNNYTKDTALNDIRTLKKYDSYKDAEFKLISFDIETKI
jgi:hypothetical protein